MNMQPEKAKALELSSRGQHDQAVRLMREVVANRQRDSEQAMLDDYMLLAGCLFNSGEIEETVSVLEHAASLFPDQPVVLENLGVAFQRLGKLDRAAESLEAALLLGSTSENLLDALCAAHGSSGDMENVRRYGVQALLAKDTAACQDGHEYPVPAGQPPVFDAAKPDKNVISFSLWGDDPRYTNGALRNADLMPEIYPGWRARFYADDSIPSQVRARLQKLGADVVDRPNPRTIYDGLMWRFEVIGDESVDRFLIRDADSLINTQERMAVDEWLSSDRYFHVMRDWYTHTDLVLAGMWGGVAGVLPSLESLTSEFKPFRMPNRNFDQDFLRMSVWPTVKKSCLIHDSYFNCLGSVPFPAFGRLPSGLHVGQNFEKRTLRKSAPQDRRR